MSHVVEVATYKLQSGIQVPQLREALEPLHAFIAARPGCLGIHTCIDRDGTKVTDLLFWRTQAEADAAMAATEHDASLQALLPLAQPGSFSCTHAELVLETRP